MTRCANGGLSAVKGLPRQGSGRGFTLIETLVAVAILIGVIVGPVSLISHSLFSSSFSRNDLVAYNLAQEGIELFRAIRDNNILCASLGGATPWNTNPNGGGPFHGYHEIDVVNQANLSCGSDLINTPLPTTRTVSTCNTPLRADSNGLYSYAAGTLLNVTRCVIVCSPPNAAPCSVAADSDVPSDKQMEVISTVSWIERGTPKSVTLRDRLYDWK